jgi:hypothetical protein
MSLSDIDIGAIERNLAQASERLAASWGQLKSPVYGVSGTPEQLESALEQLFEVLKRWEELDAPQRPELDRLGTYALELIEEIAATAALLQLEDLGREIELQAYPLGIWLARRGGRLDRIAPIVNAVAFLANHSSESADLQRLYRGISEIIEAVSPAIRSDLAESGPGRPWRLLLLNRAIVATRSHDPDLMEAAFSAVVEQLPDDAPRFFSEGIQQMDLLGYPHHVRRVMQRFHDQWSAGRRMH